jgi:hypothetical protein
MNPAAIPDPGIEIEGGRWQAIQIVDDRSVLISNDLRSDDLVFRLGPDIDNHQLGLGYRRRLFAAQRFDELLLEALLESVRRAKRRRYHSEVTERTLA